MKGCNILDIADLKNYQPPCEPVKPLVYVIATDEIISGYESKYRRAEKQFNNYKQLNDTASLEHCCSPKLIKLYESRDCKNLQKYKPSKLEIDAVKAKAKEIKNLPINTLMKTAKEARDIQKNSPIQKIIDEQKKLDDLINPQWKKDLEELSNPAWKKHLEELSNPAWKKHLEEMRAVQVLHQNQITPALINTAETALKALGSHAALKEKIASLKPYQKEIDHVLSRGIDAQVAQAMYGTHSELLEQFRNLKPPKKPKKNEKYWKQKAKQIGEEKTKELEEKDKQHAKEIEELHQIYAKREAKLKEENRRIILAMSNNQEKPKQPKAQHFLNNLFSKTKQLTKLTDSSLNFEPEYISDNLSEQFNDWISLSKKLSYVKHQLDEEWTYSPFPMLISNSIKYLELCYLKRTWDFTYYRKVLLSGKLKEIREICGGAQSFEDKLFRLIYLSWLTIEDPFLFTIQSAHELEEILTKISSEISQYKLAEHEIEDSQREKQLSQVENELQNKNKEIEREKQMNDNLMILIEENKKATPQHTDEPAVIKGKPETLQAWILWKIENQGKDNNGNIIYGYQATLIKEAVKFDYSDDSAVKRAWANLKNNGKIP